MRFTADFLLKWLCVEQWAPTIQEVVILSKRRLKNDENSHDFGESHAAERHALGNSKSGTELFINIMKIHETSLNLYNMSSFPGNFRPSNGSTNVVPKIASLCRKFFCNNIKYSRPFCFRKGKRKTLKLCVYIYILLSGHLIDFSLRII